MAPQLGSIIMQMLLYTSWDTFPETFLILAFSSLVVHVNFGSYMSEIIRYPKYICDFCACPQMEIPWSKNWRFPNFERPAAPSPYG